MQSAALGFAPHSGWAALVVVGGSAAEPTVVLRDRIEMADAKLTGSKQPYHEVEDWPLPEAKKYLDRLSESAQSITQAALREVLGTLDQKGYRPAKAGILESSGRKGSPLAAILASHALIHTAEGEHFRLALEVASAFCGLAVRRVTQRGLLDLASTALRKRADRLQASVQALGRPLGPPWGADQKAAALLAWMLLSDGSAIPREGERTGSGRKG